MRHNLALLLTSPFAMDFQCWHSAWSFEISLRSLFISMESSILSVESCLSLLPKLWPCCSWNRLSSLSLISSCCSLKQKDTDMIYAAYSQISNVCRLKCICYLAGNCLWCAAATDICYTFKCIGEMCQHFGKRKKDEASRQCLGPTSSLALLVNRPSKIWAGQVYFPTYL